MEPVHYFLLKITSLSASCKTDDGMQAFSKLSGGCFPDAAAVSLISQMTVANTEALAFLLVAALNCSDLGIRISVYRLAHCMVMVVYIWLPKQLVEHRFPHMYYITVGWCLGWRGGELRGYQREQVALPRMEEYRLCRTPGPSPSEGTSYILAHLAEGGPRLSMSKICTMWCIILAQPN